MELLLKDGNIIMTLKQNKKNTKVKKILPIQI